MSTKTLTTAVEKIAPTAILKIDGPFNDFHAKELIGIIDDLLTQEFVHFIINFKLCTEVNNYGVSRIIYTDINRDGMKSSPNFEETIKIAELANCPVVISGGVSSINDIKKAKELNNNKIEGIIIGKAIYDGDIKLDDLAKEIDA